MFYDTITISNFLKYNEGTRQNLEKYILWKNFCQQNKIDLNDFKSFEEFKSYDSITDEETLINNYIDFAKWFISFSRFVNQTVIDINYK